MGASSEASGDTRGPRWKGLLSTVLVLVALVGAAILVGPSLLNLLRVEDGRLHVGSECVVETREGNVDLTREEAKSAITAVALTARGEAAPDTSDIDPAALEGLPHSPSEDAGPGLHCEGTGAGELPEQELTPSGLTPRAQRVLERMTEVFGEQPVGGFAPGGVSQGHGGESTHYDGRGVDVFFRPVTEENRAEGWILAQWLMAHADDLDIQYVIFDDKIWSDHSSRGHWQNYNAPEPATDVLRHLDHVHVDVHKGGER